ncbi:glycosyltransferase [Comamonas aquatica]|uniref:O-linked N-acetylglucosamine transferase, SPINDLY family protein n=1 Tax=Comamonas aquatica TaxID=225991 RepID=UPI0024492827|nr:glycosyltransferase [Comamonas aquatica]MDH0383050.1 glycosyltransferase [Comamonas aquatica]MDH0430930.1 glycosyltransferase [Comamonas aquatica]MDH0941994.1 glycosyltransferase [Comamonas aquatica]
MSEPILSVAPKALAPVEQELHRINTSLVAGGQFLEALRQLMLLAVEHAGNAQLWLLVGLVYSRIAHWKPAIGALETALQLDPNDNQAKQLLSLALFSVGQKEQACQLIDQVCSYKGANSAQWMLRAYLHAHTSSDPMHALQVARDWGKRFADPLTRKAKPLKVQDRNPRKKLKIGYVTADFREHSVAFFMQPVLQHHNPDHVEIHVYFNGYWDHITPQMRVLVPHWLDIMDMSDEEVCKQIREDQIDVLVDLSGFTQGHRLGVFARRAAPVQVTWLGYMLPLGMKAMDYRFVGIGVQALGHEAHYSETLFYLRGMVCYMPPAYAPLCEEPPMLRNGYPTLVSLNSSAKITDKMLKIWARILHLREDARLIIMVKEENADSAQAHMQPRVEAAGMPLDRVSVLHQQPLKQFMEMGHIADIMLDTAPISGGTTTLHALWMGMLIVTMDAERDVDAATARTLRSFRFGGEIAKDEQGYVDAALLLMNSPERLQARRLVQRDAMRRTALMNYAERTQSLERAFRLMWLNYLRGDRQLVSDDVDLD